MINVVIPMAGESRSFQEAGFIFPKPLVEVDGRCMIEYVMDNLRLRRTARTIFVIREEDRVKFNLDLTLRRLVEDSVILATRGSAGAACTALLAVDYINNEEPLVVANADQYLKCNVEQIIGDFIERDVDGGIITFDSVHPRWSYVCTNGEGLVIEAVEKKPISRQATVGIYYFKRGKDFVNAVTEMLRCDDTFNGAYYICPAFNYLVLQGKVIATRTIAKDAFISFGSSDYVRHILSQGLLHA